MHPYHIVADAQKLIYFVICKDGVTVFVNAVVFPALNEIFNKLLCGGILHVKVGEHARERAVCGSSLLKCLCGIGEIGVFTRKGIEVAHSVRDVLGFRHCIKHRENGLVELGEVIRHIVVVKNNIVGKRGGNKHHTVAVANISAERLNNLGFGGKLTLGAEILGLLRVKLQICKSRNKDKTYNCKHGGKHYILLTTILFWHICFPPFLRFCVF